MKNKKTLSIICIFIALVITMIPVHAAATEVEDSLRFDDTTFSVQVMDGNVYELPKKEIVVNNDGSITATSVHNAADNTEADIRKSSEQKGKIIYAVDFKSTHLEVCKIKNGIDGEKYLSTILGFIQHNPELLEGLNGWTIIVMPTRNGFPTIIDDGGHMVYLYPGKDMPADVCCCHLVEAALLATK